MGVSNSKERKFNYEEVEYAKVYVTGNIVEVVAMKQKPTGDISQWKRLPGNLFRNDETGEVIEGKPAGQGTGRNWDRVFHENRRLILCNFEGGESELFIVLTYEPNQKGRSSYYAMRKDVKCFIGKLRYAYPNIEYLAFPEQHVTDNEGWHIHLLVKDRSGNKLAVDNSIINKLWGKGFTQTERIRSIERVSNYFKVAEESRGYYPPRCRYPWRSKGIQKPEATIMTGIELKELVGDTSPDYIHVYTHSIINEDGKEIPVNEVTYLKYRNKR